MSIGVIRCTPRSVGTNGGWASLITGSIVEHGPDLAIFVKDRVDAYQLVEWVTPLENTGDKRIDRAFVDYRSFEPNWLQVKLIVEEEHRDVLNRLSDALTIRDGYLDQELLQWAINPNDHQEPWGYRLKIILEQKLKAQGTVA